MLVYTYCSRRLKALGKNRMIELRHFTFFVPGLFEKVAVSSLELSTLV